jgi:glutathione S-transferase
MATIYYSKLSPYAAKVRMAAVHVGYPARSQPVDTLAPPAEFLDSNPLGKVPVLVPEDGAALHDSRVIMQFLDRWAGGGLYPAYPRERMVAMQYESLCDGVCDCLQAIMSERRHKPEERQHQPWVDRQWDKVLRTLPVLERDLPPEPLDVRGLALRATLGYMAIRFEGEWEPSHPVLAAWAKSFDGAHPGVAGVAPSMTG